MCFCSRKGCGWNKTHTSGFHAAWNKDKKGFRLPSAHEFMVKKVPGGDSSGDGGNNAGDASGTAAASQLQGADSAEGLAGMSAGMVLQHKEKTNKVLEHYKNNAQDSNLSSMCADLQEIWGLN